MDRKDSAAQLVEDMCGKLNDHENALRLLIKRLNETVEVVNKHTQILEKIQKLVPDIIVESEYEN